MTTDVSSEPPLTPRTLTGGAWTVEERRELRTDTGAADLTERDALFATTTCPEVTSTRTITGVPVVASDHLSEKPLTRP